MTARGRRRRRIGYVLLVLGVPGAALFGSATLGGCDEVEREKDPRFYFPPDGPEEDADADADVVVPSRDSAVEVDAGDAGDASDGAELPKIVRAIATGSAEHPDAAVGHGDHTCVIAGATRDLYCWGANDYGQIGNGKTGAGTFAEDVTAAAKVAIDETGLPFDGLVELSLAAHHSCARRNDVLFCWGQRLSGAQAEPPSAAVPSPDRTAPRAIGNLDVMRISAGGPHTCALKTNGKLVCFGHSTFNELGRPNADDVACAAPFFYDYLANPAHQCSGKLLEVSFGALAGTSRVVSGESHSCARAGGRAMCWGATANGALGRPLAGPSELNAQIVVTDPGALTPLDGVLEIASDGAKHTCALRTNGVVCWGLNDVGQLGADPTTVMQRPFAGPPVAGTTGALAIGVAERVTCAVRSDATVACWGADLAVLGDGGAGSSFAPLAIKGPGGVGLLGNVAAIAPGARHACALKKDGTVWCWGKNDRGQLGDGTKVDATYPVKVTGLPP